MNYVRDYYNNIELPDGPFGFSHVHESQITNILENFDTRKILVDARFYCKKYQIL